MNFATLKGLTIPEGVVTQIADASGRVLWAKITEIIPGSVILRPSADIFVEHTLYPTSSTAAYLLINEEVSDGDSTYIHANGKTSTSEFQLSGEAPPVGAMITSVTLYAVRWSGGNAAQVFTLKLNGTSIASVSWNKGKDLDGNMSLAIEPINSYFAENKTLPPLTINVESEGGTDNKGISTSGVTQVYVVLTYE